jgi:hypothetical protein
MYYCDIIWNMTLLNVFCLRVVSIAGNSTKIVGAMSKKETWLNYSNQAFARHLFNTISSLGQLATNEWHLSNTFMKIRELIRRLLLI